MQVAGKYLSKILRRFALLRTMASKGVASSSSSSSSSLLLQRSAATTSGPVPPEGTRVISEGAANVLFAKNAGDGDDKGDGSVRGGHAAGGGR